ncbi:MAG: type II toxin-antitoxin system Phd/YefM family antitoxin [Allosphingosinicella sp.]
MANSLSHYMDLAMARPAAIQRRGIVQVVMISLKEYERLLRRDRQVLLTKDIDAETLEAIRDAQPSERSKALNYLMDVPEED